MAPYSSTIELANPSETRLFAQVLSLQLRNGDVVALRGDLGAGKTTLARHLIRAFAADDELEVPSPTYALMQSYNTSRFDVCHYDLYRLADADELYELGFPDNLENAVSIIEWPELAAEVLPDNRIEVYLSELRRDEIDCRTARLTAVGISAARMRRAANTWFFLKSWCREAQLCGDEIHMRYLQGDASARSYARLQMPNRSLMFMDTPPQPDGPPIRDGLSYSRIAHLAEDIRPFIAIGAELHRRGCRVPETYHVEAEKGFAIIEDLGPAVFGDLIAQGHDIEPLYRQACDVLVHLGTSGPPAEVSGYGCRHRMPVFDQGAMEIEVQLLLDWFVPFATGRQAADTERRTFLDIWHRNLDRLEQQKAWILRDFHSPNLLWLPEREGVARVGLIDYQDAMIGHRAYDVVSLLQDARLDVSEDAEQRLLRYYLDQMRATGQSCDESDFRYAYALLGAQRNTKILGIFARLAKRDGKSQYLRHIPRLCRYLRRCLEHPELKDIRAWFAEYLPEILQGKVSLNLKQEDQV